MERKCITLSKDNCQHRRFTEQNQTDKNKSWKINLLEFSLYLKFSINCEFHHKKYLLKNTSMLTHTSTIILEIYYKLRYTKCNYGKIN